MKKHLYTRQSTKKVYAHQELAFIGISLLGLILFICSCNTGNSTSNSFKGEEKAIALADQMFDAIGGKDAWCDLRSLYIKATHTEPQMTIPYQSEIWRAIDQFELVIEQQNDSFHVKAVTNDAGGTIRYYDDRDTFRLLTPEQLNDWEYDHQHNIYVMLHDLGCNPQNYTVKFDENDRLAFYQDSIFLTGFGLDEQMRPHLFFVPGSDGKIRGSRFTHWGRDDQLVHSAGGHPLDSNFMYRTQIWQPSKTSLREAFGDSIFAID